MDPKSTGTQESKKDKKDGVQGEGNYDAARRYDEGVRQSVRKGDVDKLAEEAQKALEGPEGDALRDAERLAKEGTAETALQAKERERERERERQRAGR
jgi:hypothetical protein